MFLNFILKFVIYFFEEVVLFIIHRTVAALGLMQGETIIFVSSMLLSPLMVSDYKNYII